MHADSTEECYTIMCRSCLGYHAMMPIPDCRRWSRWFYNVSPEHMRRVYAFYKKQIQLIGYNSKYNLSHWIYTFVSNQVRGHSCDSYSHVFVVTFLPMVLFHNDFSPAVSSPNIVYYNNQLPDIAKILTWLRSTVSIISLISKLEAGLRYEFQQRAFYQSRLKYSLPFKIIILFRDYWMNK